jgi:C4-dicarboxylate-binding protein DctP
MKQLQQATPDRGGRSRRRAFTALLGNSLLFAAQGFVAMCISVSQAHAQTPIVIQFSHVVTADTAKGRAALKFKELAEQRTNGRVRIEVYPNSQLYKDREEMDALRLGAVQMLAPSLSKLAGVGGTDFEAFDLPFLFQDHAAYRRVVDGAIGAELLHRLEAKDIKGLAYWDNGFKVFTANRSLQTVQDFKGLKIRVQASKTLVKQMQRMGADPSISPLINVFEALRMGKLDGEENTPVNVASQRLHEVQSHLTVSNHGYLAYAVIVNKAFWDKLPVDIRITLEAAMRDTTAFVNSIAEAENTKALERIRASGKLSIYTPGAQELDQWRKLLDPVSLAAQSGIRPELVKAIQAVTRAPP